MLIKKFSQFKPLYSKTYDKSLRSSGILIKSLDIFYIYKERHFYLKVTAVLEILKNRPTYPAFNIYLTNTHRNLVNNVFLLRYKNTTIFNKA